MLLSHLSSFLLAECHTLFQLFSQLRILEKNYENVFGRYGQFLRCSTARYKALMGIWMLGTCFLVASTKVKVSNYFSSTSIESDEEYM